MSGSTCSQLLRSNAARSMSRPHSPRPPLTPLDVSDAFLKSPAMARQRRRSSASDSATSEPSSERSFRIHAPSRRRGLFKSSNLLLLAIALLCLAVFRLGLDFRSVGGPALTNPRQFRELASWRKDPKAIAFQEALARWESTVADEGEAKIWPPDTPADRRAPKCIGFNTRAQCVRRSCASDVPGAFSGLIRLSSIRRC